MKCKKIRYIVTSFAMVLVLLWLATCYCPHKVTCTKIVKEATCFELGQIDIICERCDKVVESNTLEKEAHTYGEAEVKWTYVKYATPFERGVRYKKCKFCEFILSENYTIPALENNSIYITGTDINHTFTISSFSQSAIDKYDIVYSDDSMIGANNPFILGHDYRSLGILYQTKVGEHIYLYINGTIEIYEVIVSEYGVYNSEKNDIIGQTTGTSIWHNYDCKTLHLYTCYGMNKNGRWMVLAKQIFES